MEGILAMNILCTASQLNLDALNLVQSLAMGHLEQPTQGKSTLQPNVTNPFVPKELTPRSTRTRSGDPSGKETTPSPKFELDTAADTPTPHSKKNEVATLNVLGVQPDFNMADNESLYTVDQTVMSSQTGGEGGTKAEGKFIKLVSAG